jgi:hypothetical protein
MVMEFRPRRNRRHPQRGGKGIAPQFGDIRGGDFLNDEWGQLNFERLVGAGFGWFQIHHLRKGIGDPILQVGARRRGQRRFRPAASRQACRQKQQGHVLPPKL